MTFIYDDIISNCQVQSALKVISLPQFKQTFGPYKLLVFKRSLGVLPNVPASSRIRAKSWRNSPKITFKKWLNRLVLNLKLSSSTPCQTKKNSVKIIYKKKRSSCSTKPEPGKIFEYHETFQVPFCARAPSTLNCSTSLCRTRCKCELSMLPPRGTPRGFGLLVTGGKWILLGDLFPIMMLCSCVRTASMGFC